LDEVLADPIVQLVLRRDRIEDRDLIQYFDEMRKRLQSSGDAIKSKTVAAPALRVETTLIST
jgi:hypothetical protein